MGQIHYSGHTALKSWPIVKYSKTLYGQCFIVSIIIISCANPDWFESKEESYSIVIPG